MDQNSSQNNNSDNPFSPATVSVARSHLREALERKKKQFASYRKKRKWEALYAKRS